MGNEPLVFLYPPPHSLGPWLWGTYKCSKLRPSYWLKVNLKRPVRIFSQIYLPSIGNNINTLCTEKTCQKFLVSFVHILVSQNTLGSNYKSYEVCNIQYTVIVLGMNSKKHDNFVLNSKTKACFQQVWNTSTLHEIQVRVVYD